MINWIMYICTGLSTIASVLIFIATFYLWKATKKLAIIEFIRYTYEDAIRDLLATTMKESIDRQNEKIINIVIKSSRVDILKKQFPNEFKLFTDSCTGIIDELAKRGNMV